jgi:hypothetical protein
MEAVCRVANAVRALATLSLLINPSSILRVCKVRSGAVAGVCVQGKAPTGGLCPVGTQPPRLEH